MARKGWQVATILLSIALILAIGISIYCRQKISSLSLENKRIGQEIISLKQSSNRIEKEDSDCVNNGDTICIGWKKYKSNGNLAFLTDNWQDYSYLDLNENEYLPFSIEYPDSWTISGTVFNDARGAKIAEFSPGLVILEKGQKCFDNEQGRNGMVESISQKDISKKTPVFQVAPARRVTADFLAENDYE
ncbi:MAG: hypothetical protein NTZ80_04235, partial [Patescibacteria group bacterium]|nr:hypothetical protein [Patescibacteria group bacterium]